MRGWSKENNPGPDPHFSPYEPNNPPPLSKKEEKEERKRRKKEKGR